jgi:hypothetical protein
MAAIYIQHYQQFFDGKGDPLAGGKLFTYQAGTTIPKAAYTSPSESVQHPNPIILNLQGKPESGPIFIKGAYKFVLLDENDVPVANGTTDNVSAMLTMQDLTSVMLSGYRFLERVYITNSGDFEKANYPNAAAFLITLVGGGASAKGTDAATPEPGNPTIFRDIAFLAAFGGQVGDSLGNDVANDGVGGLGGTGVGGDLIVRGGSGGGASRGTGDDLYAGHGGSSMFGGGPPGRGFGGEFDLDFWSSYGAGGAGFVASGRSCPGSGAGGTVVKLLQVNELLDIESIIIGSGYGNAKKRGQPGLAIIDVLGVGGVQLDPFGPDQPAPGGQGVEWNKNEVNAPVTEYINGIRLEKFNELDSQEIYGMIVVPQWHEPGHPISLRSGKCISDLNTGKVLFRATSWLLRGAISDVNNLTEIHQSTNLETAVSVTSGVVSEIGTIDLTTLQGVIGTEQVLPGDRILVKLFRDNANEIDPVVGDVKLLIKTLELSLGLV